MRDRRPIPRAWLVALLGLLLLGTSALATVTKMGVGATITLLTITNLINNAVSPIGPVTAADNYIGGGSGDGFLACTVEGVFTFGGFPVEGSAVAVYWNKSIDDSNFETPCGLGTPAITLPVSSAAFTTRKIGETFCPIGRFKACALNDNTGQQINSGTVKVRFLTPEGL